MVVSGVKGFSHTYTCIHSPPNPPPIQAGSFFKKLFIYFWLHWVLVAACGSSIAVHRLFSSCGRQAPECMGSVAVACGLSGSTAYGILVAWWGIESMSPSLESEFLTTMEVSLRRFFKPTFPCGISGKIPETKEGWDRKAHKECGPWRHSGTEYERVFAFSMRPLASDYAWLLPVWPAPA